MRRGTLLQAGRELLMPSSTKRILKQRGRIKLIETTNPLMGIGYSVWDRSLGLWSGESLSEAERQFDQAVAAVSS